MTTAKGSPMNGKWNQVDRSAIDPTKSVFQTVEQRSDESRRVKAMTDKQLIAYYRNESNPSYGRGKARYEILRRRLMTAQELDAK